MSLPRTVVVHVLTVVAHWAVLLSERDDLRRLHAGMDVKTLIARGVAPQLVLLVLYGQLFHSLTKTYGIRTVDNERLHKLQTVAMLSMTALVFPLWKRVIAPTK
mmetsp:Transcript_60155/g.164821  ORF Transcript_60155/g.164821 Transcript_60155/m.164821 type:complete len:104 (+) Transcript_60155:498-809(+)